MIWRYSVSTDVYRNELSGAHMTAEALATMAREFLGRAEWMASLLDIWSQRESGVLPAEAREHVSNEMAIIDTYIGDLVANVAALAEQLDVESDAAAMLGDDDIEAPTHRDGPHRNGQVERERVPA